MHLKAGQLVVVSTLWRALHQSQLSDEKEVPLGVLALQGLLLKLALVSNYQPAF